MNWLIFIVWMMEFYALGLLTVFFFEVRARKRRPPDYAHIEELERELGIGDGDEWRP